MKKEKSKQTLKTDILKQVSGGRRRRPEIPPTKVERPDRGTVGPLTRMDE